MSAATFALALVRVLAAVGAAGFAAHRSSRALGYGPDPLGRLATTVAAVSLLLVSAEALGLVGALRTVPLIVLLVAEAVAAWGLTRHRPAAATAAGEAGDAEGAGEARGTGDTDDTRAGPGSSRARALAAVAVALVAAQWLLATANALGGGMYNFDTLWYHMPFAAGFALSGSVTGIHFTQADPWVAYYPANSELIHAVGLVLVHADLLSPLINLGWLAVLLLGAWCVGRPWRVQPATLTAGALVAGLPVLASTQPGEAFNDIAGVAMLMAAAAFLVDRSPPGAPLTLGLALGFSLGVKFTFVVPVGVIVIGWLIGERRRPGAARRTAVMLLALATTGSWWYLRNLIRVGNPLGARLHVGPLTLAGPHSPLSASSQQSVLSEVRHLSLWGSRFIPGLTHMFGVLWPLIGIACLLVLAVTLSRRGRSVHPGTRLLALAAAAAAVTYLVLPTGATNIGTGTALFEVNLRYTAPALALALVIVPVAVGARRTAWAAGAMLAALVLSQAEPALWPTSPGRHVGFLVLAGMLTAAAVMLWGRRDRLAATRGPLLGGGLAVALVALFGAGDVVQRHYLQRRYRTTLVSDPRLGEIYAWAQTVSHARIALYGTVEQYPLYGALVTNRVDYLGRPSGDGGVAPISDCSAWRATIDRLHAQYVVMTPGPTGQAPLTWTAADPAAQLVLAPGPDAEVFALSGPLNPRACPRA